MKVILITKVVNIGNIGDVVNVKDGYAKNFLIPQNKAIHYSKANYKVFEEKKVQFEEDSKKILDAANEVKKHINSSDIIIIENASDDGRLYGSVSTVDIAAKINQITGKKSVSRSNIILEKPIKEIGVYSAGIDLHSDANFNVRLIVTRSESDVKALLEKDKENKKVAKNADNEVDQNSSEGSDKDDKKKVSKKSSETTKEVTESEDSDGKLEAVN